MINYPKDWYKHLKKGDIVKCIAHSTGARSIGVYYKCTRGWNKDGISYKKDWTSVEYHEFIPISMKKFPNPNESIENYEIY